MRPAGDIRLTRRRFLAAAAATGAAALAEPALVDAVTARPRRRRTGLEAIEHVVILMQENRSFDHLLGTLRGVAGWDDPAMPRLYGVPVYAQPAGLAGWVTPFRLDTGTGPGECTNDVVHRWGIQHRAWNGGRMDRFLAEEAAALGFARGALTLGYYERADLPLTYALADAFTVCDHYHASVLGPTDSNRLYAMSASLGASGEPGGPVLTTLEGDRRADRFGALAWPTMPERLSAEGVSWKVYSGPDAMGMENVLPYFRAYQDDLRLAVRAMAPAYPEDFEEDVRRRELPHVSWVLPAPVDSQHPPAPVGFGERVIARVLAALAADERVWSRTVLFVTWDEGGGFFDHVPPPVAPPGTHGEWLQAPPAAAEGIAGPIGLGFRVPLLVCSPFSRGGYVSSDVFDHTSLLRFLEARFGVEVPNLSAWRRAITGDLTATLDLSTPPSAAMPALPPPRAPERALDAARCPADLTAADLESESARLRPYPPPPDDPPRQEPGTRPQRGRRA